MRLVACRAAAHRDLRQRPPRDAGTFALDESAPRLGPHSYVADGACLVGDVELGERSSVWFCAVVRADNGPIRIGSDSNVQDGAVIHCLPGGQTRVGNQVSIGHLAAIHGAHIGDRCLIGMHAVVMDAASIGDDTVVAAASLVPAGRSFEPGVLLRGSPARVVRRLTDRELDAICANARQYTLRAEHFRRALTKAAITQASGLQRPIR